MIGSIRKVLVLVTFLCCDSDLLLAKSQMPNVVLILADDVGHEVLGCYGGESYPTPQLDALASGGIRFQHCYSMPTCHPTRLTLMLGRYPFRMGDVPWGSFPRAEETNTFSRALQDAGYATGVFGKWQMTLLRDDPSHVARLGFQHSDIFGWHEGPRYYEPMIYRNGRVRDDTLGHYGPDLYVRSLIEFMKQNRDRPFLAYYPMALCHDVTDDLDAPVPHGPFDRYDSYAEMVTEMDRAVGRVVAALEALELREKTLILFVGDNGTPTRMIIRAEGDRLVRVPVSSRQNGKVVPGGKGTLKDSGTHVPLLANWPGKIEGGQVVADLVDMSDFYPTLLELAGVAVPENLDGISFAQRFVDGTPSKRKVAYSESRRDEHWVRTARWKLYNDGRLFDMQQDPNELTPLVGAISGERAGIKQELHSALKSLRIDEAK